MARQKSLLMLVWMMILMMVVFYELTYEPETPPIDKTPEGSVDKAQLIQYLEVNDDVEVVFEVGLNRIEHHVWVFKKDMPLHLAEEVFHMISTESQVQCRDPTRIGSELTGWDVCVTSSFEPRAGGTIYSLGLSEDWSFEEAAVTQLKCEVKVFDPSLGLKDHEYKPKIHFYNTGIGKTNTVNRKYWKIRTLGTLLKQLRDEDKYIEYLKIDIHYGEIDALETLFEENVLQRVKQLGIDFHIDNINKMGKDQFYGYGKFMNDLGENKWRKWFSQEKQKDSYQSKRTGRYWPSQIRNVFINTEYMFTNKQKKVELSPIKIEGKMPDD